jgi:outer membrane receptor protein involved in Fe transport
MRARTDRRPRPLTALVAQAALAALCLPVWAHATANDDDATTVGQVVVTASHVDMLGTAVTASQGAITEEEIRLRPIYRVGQLLESVPGLVVSIHSGEGKAPQYLLRGFNIDHGTDLADFIDDMPINRPTNAHGQGYSDLNFIIPQVLDGLDFTKGAFFPAIGDFGAVGSIHLHLANEIPNQISVSAGTLDDDEVFLGGTHHFGPEDRLVGAFDFAHLDGPYTPVDNFRKYAALLRYSHGDATDGYSMTGMYFHDQGNFTTDQPLRAVREGLIGRYGTLDPSDGTRNERYSLSARWTTHGDGWRLTTNLYAIHSKQTLFNDFTHFLFDPVNGDQEQQDENRNTAGGGAAVALPWRVGGIESTTTFGMQGRYDDSYIDRRHTIQRVVLPYCLAPQLGGPATVYNVGLGVCSADKVRLGDEALYVENNARLTSWLRTDIGARQEFYQASDRNLVPLPNGALFSGSKAVTLFQPKGSLTLGPWYKTELYVSAGRGFHSDDARGVLQTVPLEGIPPIAGPTPLLARADEEEVGLRTDAIPHTHVQISAFNIDLQSELVYDQDMGQDQASAPSNRTGVEISGQYRPQPWLELNTDLSFSRARFTANNLALYGFDGNYIAEAPNFVGSFGVLVDNLGPWYGSLEVRILGSYPLTTDNSQRDAGYTETNLNVGYKFGEHLKAQVGIFNLFDVKANAFAYYYQTEIPGDPPGGESDHQNHPLEPTSARLTLTATF